MTATLTVASAVSVAVPVAIVAAVTVAISLPVAVALMALVVRHADRDGRGRDVAGGVGALNRDRVDPSVSFS